MKLVLSHHLPPLLWASLIFFASSLPESQLPSALPYGADKVAHFIEYAVLAFLLARSLEHARQPTLRRRAAVIGALAAWLFGVTDEVHQLFVPGRFVEAADLLADAAGAWAGVLVRLRLRSGKRG